MRIIFRRGALIDLRAAYQWYEQQEAGLGNRFKLALDDVINSISERPETSQTIYRDMRRAILKGFP